MISQSTSDLITGANDAIPLSVGSSNPTVVLLVGVAILVFGYLIRYQGMTELINGVNMAAVADEERVGNLVGGVSIVLGLITLGYAALLTQGIGGGTVESAYGAVVVVLAVGAVFKARGL